MLCSHALSSIAQNAGKSVEWSQQAHSTLDAQVVAKMLQAAQGTDRCRSAAARLNHSSTAAGQAAGAAASDPLPPCPAAAQGRNQQTGLQQAEAGEGVVRTSSFGRPLRSPSYSLPDEPSSNSKVGLRYYLVLVSMEAEAGAATGTATAGATGCGSSSTSTAMQGKCYSIIEVKGVQVLMTDLHGQDPTPLDLHDCWQRQVPHIRSCLSQLYTYMFAEGVCYGESAANLLLDPGLSCGVISTTVFWRATNNNRLPAIASDDVAPGIR